MGNFRQKVNINVQIVEDLEEFKQIISDEQQAAVAVMFYSPVCKACKTSKPLFNKLAKKYTDVKFISVPMTKAQVWESINVPTKYPFGHIYDQNGALVNEVGLLRKLIPKFEESLQSFVAQQDNNDDENR
jgi:thiol-disulfide isomerase/thioredoxin